MFIFKNGSTGAKASDLHADQTHIHGGRILTYINLKNKNEIIYKETKTCLLIGSSALPTLSGFRRLEAGGL